MSIAFSDVARLLTDLLADLALVLGHSAQHVDGLLDALVDDLHVVERLLADRLLLTHHVLVVEVQLLLHVSEVVETALSVLLLRLDVVTQRLGDVINVGAWVGEHLQKRINKTSAPFSAMLSSEADEQTGLNSFPQSDRVACVNKQKQTHADSRANTAATELLNEFMGTKLPGENTN